MSLTPKNLNYILDLFEKLQDLSITKEEYRELRQWVALSEENKKVWDDFHNSDKIESDRLLFESFDTESALSTIKNVAKKRMILKYIAAAAVLFIIFSTTLFLFTARTTSKIENDVIANNDILPAGNKNQAILKFSDAETIILNRSQDGIRLSQNGISYKDGELIAQSQKNAPARWVTLSVPRGSKYELTLDDGTKIWVNADTELKFPQTFVNSQSREVELSGEAYFEVAHNAKKPFKVKMDDEVVEVLGTSFSLSNYESDELAKSTLFTGKIALMLSNPQLTKTFLSPGQQAVYNKQQKKLDVLAVDGKKELAWKQGDFLFESDHILTIMKQVARWYDIDVVYQGDFKQSYFSGIVSRSQPLSAVLEMLATTEKLKFKINKERKEVILTAN